MAFQKATKRQAKLRKALIGPSGSGKTYSALLVATHLVPGGRIAVIDTERGSASKYADEFAFDVAELVSFHPQHYIDAIREAEAAGYDVLVIDSLSHAWMGKDGALELVDKVAKRSQSNNNFTAWREVTPLHNALVDAMLQANLHIIVTMRAKTEYVLETNEKGKQVPRKVGMAPIQRDGLEYEFDVVADMTLDNDMIVSKTRCRALAGAVIRRPGKDVADLLRQWLTDGAPAASPPPPPPADAASGQGAQTRLPVDDGKYVGGSVGAGANPPRSGSKPAETPLPERKPAPFDGNAADPGPAPSVTDLMKIAQSKSLYLKREVALALGMSTDKETVEAIVLPKLSEDERRKVLAHLQQAQSGTPRQPVGAAAGK